MQSLKPFISYFPPRLWLILFVALVLHYLIPEIRQLCDLVINFCFIYFFGKIATVIHEAGHLTVAHWVGATPRRMTLGWGHEVHRTYWRNIRIVLKSNPMGGYAMAIFKDMPLLKLKFAAFILGGVFFNAAAWAIVYFLFGYDSSFVIGKPGIDAASAFIFVNALTVLNLIPFTSSVQGYAQPTDGLLLLRVIFLSREKNFSWIEFAEDYFAAYEFLDDEKFDQAHEVIMRLYAKAPDDINVLSFLGGLQLKRLQLDEAFQNFRKIEAEMLAKKQQKKLGHVYNCFAWIYLLKNDIDEAYHYATQALKLLPRNSYVQGTYGSILVERGNLDYGIQWLLFHASKKHINNETLSASIYLALAYHLKKDFTKRDLHAQHVTQYESKLSMDSLALWHRCKGKMESEVHVVQNQPL